MPTRHDPAGLRTRAAITKTAAALFVRYGYDAASMDLIASEAQVSRQTIYNQFESKEELFRTIISDLADEAAVLLKAPTRRNSSPRATLLHLARGILLTALRPSALAVHRLVVAEVARFPELGQAIYGSGAARAFSQLAEFLRQQDQLGYLDVPHPEAAAEQFFAVVAGTLHLRALMGIKLLPSQIEAGAQHGVATFLRAFEAERQGIARNTPRAVNTHSGKLDKATRQRKAS